MTPGQAVIRTVCKQQVHPYHRNHTICPRMVFFGDAVALLQESYMFLQIQILWIVEAVEQLASLSQVRSGNILITVNNKTCIKYHYQRIQDILSARSLANIMLGFFRTAEIGGSSSVSQAPSWTSPANQPATIAPSMTSILKPCPSSQTPTLSPVYTQTVHFMKCSQGNGNLYGSNSERLSLSAITGRDSQISFDDVRTDIHFTLLFFKLLKIFILFYIKNFHGPAKKSVATVLYYQQS